MSIYLSTLPHTPPSPLSGGEAGVALQDLRAALLHRLAECDDGLVCVCVCVCVRFTRVCVYYFEYNNNT
jgi:hypothetical protein